MGTFDDCTAKLQIGLLGLAFHLERAFQQIAALPLAASLSVQYAC